MKRISFFLFSLLSLSSLSARDLGRDYTCFSRDLEKKNALVSVSSRKKVRIEESKKLFFLAMFCDWIFEEEKDLEVSLKVKELPFLSYRNPLQLSIGDEISLSDALYSAFFQEDEVSLLLIAEFLSFSENKTQSSLMEFALEQMHALLSFLEIERTSLNTFLSLSERKNPSFSTAEDMATLFSHSVQNPVFVYFTSQFYREIIVRKKSRKKEIFVIERNDSLEKYGVEELFYSANKKRETILLSFSVEGENLKNFRRKVILSFLGNDWEKYGANLIHRSQKAISKQMQIPQ